MLVSTVMGINSVLAWALGWPDPTRVLSVLYGGGIDCQVLLVGCCQSFTRANERYGNRTSPVWGPYRTRASQPV